tara:strand:- start:2442 stop:3539 length:1098 start_codon:yes stop_codon:yes gene_type:complete
MKEHEEVATDILKSGMKGKGVKKLNDLDMEVLKIMVDRIGATVNSPASKEDLVASLLKKKRKNAKQSRMLQSQESVASEDICKSEPAPFTRSVWKRRYTLNVCAFNALKLRLNKEELLSDWEELVNDFANRMDVLMLSEVLASSDMRSERVGGLLKRMNEVSQWNVTCSESSGPGAPEMHVMFYREHLTVVRRQTLKQLGVVQMDHAPFSVWFKDSRPGGNDFVLTSVHMPPESRGRQRDVQINKLLSSYRTEASSRLDAPLTTKGAKDAGVPFVAHIIAGDFNAFVGDDRYGANKLGFETMFGKGVSTSSGQKAYDNFLISHDTRNYYTIGSSVLELQTMQNSRRSIIGLSDHSPIFLQLGKSI